jgi:hypothetical protein
MSVAARWVSGLAALVLIVVGPGTAQAAAPEPFTITENVDFNSTSPNTFTATGPLCSNGTFVDGLKAEGGARSPLPKINLLFDTVYICADGTGTFTMTKHIFLIFSDDGSLSNTGPVELHGGTGAYTRLRGHGVDSGHAEEGIGVGQITGVIADPV